MVSLSIDTLTLTLSGFDYRHRYALERTNSFIKVWFWSRSASGVPSDVSGGASSVNTDNWVSPRITYANYQCSVTFTFHASFRAHHGPTSRVPAVLSLLNLARIISSLTVSAKFGYSARVGH